jgi:hypothetical protein
LAVVLVVNDVVGRVARPGERRRLGGQTEVGEDSAHRLAFRDDVDDAQAAVTLGALEDVDLERAAEERGPVDTWGCGVQNAAQQSVPMLDSDDVGSEEPRRRGPADR